MTALKVDFKYPLNQEAYDTLQKCIGEEVDDLPKDLEEKLKVLVKKNLSQLFPITTSGVPLRYRCSFMIRDTEVRLSLHPEGSEDYDCLGEIRLFFSEQSYPIFLNHIHVDPFLGEPPLSIYPKYTSHHYKIINIKEMASFAKSCSGVGHALYALAAYVSQFVSHPRLELTSAWGSSLIHFHGGFRPTPHDNWGVFPIREATRLFSSLSESLIQLIVDYNDPAISEWNRQEILIQIKNDPQFPQLMDILQKEENTQASLESPPREPKTDEAFLLSYLKISTEDRLARLAKRGRITPQESIEELMNNCEPTMYMPEETRQRLIDKFESR